MRDRKIALFFMQETDQVELVLRRFSFDGGECMTVGKGYHDAQYSIGQFATKDIEQPNTVGDLWPHSDPRWPVRCLCNYKFTQIDTWQRYPHDLYRDGRDGKLYTQNNAPAGAVIHAEWLHTNQGYRRGPDGKYLLIKLPNSIWWSPDMYVRDHKGEPTNNTWSRSGPIDKLTVQPSISHPTYHGIVTDGIMTECDDTWDRQKR